MLVPTMLAPTECPEFLFLSARAVKRDELDKQQKQDSSHPGLEVASLSAK